MKEDFVYLLHIAEAITDIQSYVSGGKDAFYSNKMIQDAVIRNLEIIGEAVKNITPATHSHAPEVPWKKLPVYEMFSFMIILLIDPLPNRDSFLICCMPLLVNGCS